ncbi:MAG: Nif3-like dinuclear metal center hexameric protein, partial [Eubacterium sp.]|nr:Nif3-like dinuclear metal center hexameric protein [Eubacterium sp.]
MRVKSSEIIQAIEKIAPRRLAESWDNVGLQIGSYKREVDKVLFTLDVTEEVVQEAIDIGAQMIVAHHPFIFNGLKGICTDELKGRMVELLIKNDICLYVAHTNLDKAELGLSDYIGRALGIEEMQPLDASDAEKLYKIVVYVPVTHEDVIVEVMGSCGAGFIGKYSHCTYRTQGLGTFKPLAGTQPFIGEENQVTTVEESR